MHLLHQARRRDALQHADVNAVNATMLPAYDATPADTAALTALADELDNDGE